MTPTSWGPMSTWIAGWYHPFWPQNHGNSVPHKAQAPSRLCFHHSKPEPTSFPNKPFPNHTYHTTSTNSQPFTSKLDSNPRTSHPSSPDYSGSSTCNRHKLHPPISQQTFVQLHTIIHLDTHNPHSSTTNPSPDQHNFRIQADDRTTPHLGPADDCAAHTHREFSR